MQEYDIAIVGNGPDVARNVRSWLLGVVGYAKLTDSYDSNYYRNAYYDGPLNIENVLNSAGRATIRFVCGPERYLKTGDNYTTVVTSGTTFNNPYNTIAYPFFRITKTAGQAGDGTITATNAGLDGWISQVDISAWSGTTMYIDSEIRDAYGTQTLFNNKIDAYHIGNGFPRADPNDTLTIAWSGNITKVEVKPRWWTL